MEQGVQLRESVLFRYNVNPDGIPISIKIDNENKQISPLYNTIQLEQIPDETQEIVLLKNGTTRMTQVYNEDEISDSTFYVDYTKGLAKFTEANAGRTTVINYYGKGIELISASRVYDEYTYTGEGLIKTIQEIIDEGRKAIELIKTLGDAVIIINKLQENINTGSVLHDNLVNDISIATPLQQDLHNDIQTANTFKDQLHQDVIDGKVLSPILKQDVIDGRNAKADLDRAMEQASADIAKIDSVGNKSLEIGASQFDSNHEYTWVHNMNSEDLHVTFIDSVLKEPLQPNYKKVDKNTIIIRNSDENPNIKVIVSANYHNGNSMIGTTVEDFAGDSTGIETRYARLKDSTGYKYPITKSDAVYMSDGTTKLTKKISDIGLQLETITTNHLDINIRDFGAKCDGITDDTEAIKKAINKIKNSNVKSSLNLTYGTILISENIVIPPLLKVYGQGIYKTTIKAKEGVNIIIDISDDSIYNNEFYGFTIDGNNISNIKGIYFNDKKGTINDENCKFENILIVNCTEPLTIGSNNRGNRFDNINIEHCDNGLVLNGTDNMLNNITLSSILNNGIEINGSNNHLSMCKVFYADKVGCVVNGNVNVIDIEVQENGLNGIEINGFLNNVNILADTNGRISPSHNIKIDGYKNIINGICLFNSYLNGNIDTHINILNGVINELNLLCHGNKPYLTEGCISPSNKIIINNKSLVKNIVKEGMVFEHFGTGTSVESYNYLYNAPIFYNINTLINQGCYYKKEINITGNKKYKSYLKAIVIGGACKITLSFYNSDSIISEISSEELNSYHNQDSVVFLNGDFPPNTSKVVFNIKTYATSDDGYSESVIIDYGFTIF